MKTFAKNDKKITNAWCMYDWANSVYPLTITSALFPIYWNAQTKQGIDILGMHLTDSILFSYCLSLSFIIIALLNPILGGIADSAGNKKNFMKMFVFIGAMSCFGMYFFDREHIPIGIITFVLGTIGYAGSIVFYNAYLPEIATEDRYDKLSAKGFSLGYIGGVVLLIGNLMIVMHPEWLFDMNARTLRLMEDRALITPEEATLKAISQARGDASKIAFVTVGVWWILFSLIPFYYLPNNKIKNAKMSLTKGYKELQKVYKQIKTSGLIKRFLTAFFFYSMGVQTVMYVAASFADKELKMPADNLITTILIIQLIAVAGAYLFSYISKRIGNVNTLLILTCIWISICVAAYFVYSIPAFYALAAVVGSVMGGIQSLSRSTFAKLIPLNSPDTSSYFSFYEFSEKVAIAIGTFFFGFIEHFTRNMNGEVSMRYSVLSLVVFFVLGALLLVKIRHVKIEDDE
jgi:MFS transporter, UMF1 family